MAYLFEVEFCWGFQARIVGFSKTSPSFYYPPPTTILGAIAESIAREHGLGEHKGKELISALSKNLRAIGVKPLNFMPVKYEDINRIIAIKKTREKYYPDPSDLKGSFDSPATGKTMCSPLTDDAPKLRVFLVFNSADIEFDDKKFNLSQDAFWKIHRLGTKESVVSVLNVEVLTPTIEREKTVVTNYSFPLMSGVTQKQILDGRWEQEEYLDPFKLDMYYPLKYHKGEDVITYLIPIMTLPIVEPEHVVSLSGDCVLYKVREERVIGQWQQ